MATVKPSCCCHATSSAGRHFSYVSVRSVKADLVGRISWGRYGFRGCFRRTTSTRGSSGRASRWSDPFFPPDKSPEFTAGECYNHVGSLLCHSMSSRPTCTLIWDLWGFTLWDKRIVSEDIWFSNPRDFLVLASRKSRSRYWYLAGSCLVGW